MPTLEHDALVEMFRANPELAAHLLALLFHIEVPPHTSAAVVDSALDQLVPVVFRADLVIELRDAHGAIVLAVIIEMQRGVDAEKKYSWPAYNVNVRAKGRCPTVLIVIAPDPKVAKWAAEPIDTGLGLGSSCPVVIGPATVPEVMDASLAAREAELSVLSAITHGNGPNGLAVVQAALVGLAGLDQEHAAVYFHVIYNALHEPMQRALEVLLMEQQTQGAASFPPFVQRLIDRGFSDGKLEGLRDGELKGLREGKLEGLREALLRLTARAGIALTETERARVQACSDPETLDRWIENVVGAKTAAEVLS